MIQRFSTKLLVCLSIALASAWPLRATCGNPQFAELTPILTGHDVAELAVGDVDGDGEIDLVTVSTTSGTINVRLGNGNGTFGSELTYNVPSPTEVTLADLDGDDFLDIIVASEPAQTPECVSFGSCAGFSVLMNDGNGTFGNAITTPVAYAASIVAIDTGDFTADGKLDVLVAAPPLTAGDPALHTYFGNGEGGFASDHEWSVDGTIVSAVAAKLTAGISEEGVAALVGPGTSSTSTRMLIYPSVGGTFPAISATRNITTATTPQSQLIAVDLNGNGLDDLMFTFRQSMSPELWAAGQILIISPTSLSNAGYFGESGPALTGLVAEDVDEDGDLDAMVANGTGNWKAYKRNAAGEFQFPDGSAEGTFSSGGVKTRVVSGDFNREGRPDFFFLDTANDTVVILQNACIFRSVKVTLSSSPNPSAYGGDATFTINVQQKPGAPTPQGTVTLFEGEEILGSAPVNEAGNAFITLSNLSVGAHSLRAQLAATNDFDSAFSNTHVHTVSLPPFGPPPNVTATGNSAANKITIKWQPTADTVLYEIRRRSNGAWITVGSTDTGDTFVDSTVNTSTAYVYAVRAHHTGGEISAESNSDIATTATILLPVDKKIRATDFTSTRTLINSLRSAAGLTPFTFTDASLTGVKVKAVHMNELRIALNQARTALGFAPLTFTNSPITVNTTPIRAIDIQEIRNSLQ